MRSAAIVVALGAVLVAGCAKDPLGQLIAQLDEPGGREQAIEDLLAAVRRAAPAERARVTERVIGALGDAYRTDRARPQIVGALAMLRDRRAEQVFLAAIGDAERGGAYFEAAVRAARMLADLGCRAAVPKLVKLLRRAHEHPASDREGYLRRAAIEALELLGDRRAAPVLIEILSASPTSQSVDLNRRAAKALGAIGAPAAAGPLSELLGGTRHRLLVHEASRRALCTLGPSAAQALRALVAPVGGKRRARSVEHIAAAWRVLGDLQRDDTPMDDSLSPELGLARAEAHLRWARPSLACPTPGKAATPAGAASKCRTLRWLLALVADDRRPLAPRLRAAELLGWYGDTTSAEALAAHTLGEGPALQGPLRWAVARAYARSGSSSEQLARLLASGGQPDTALLGRRRALQARLALVARCGGDQACLIAALGQPPAASRPTAKKASWPAAGRWRAAERAALELGRLKVPVGVTGAVSITAARRAAGALAARLVDVHPEVLRASLISLERLSAEGSFDATTARRVADGVASALESTNVERTGEPLVSRAFCLARRLARAAGGSAYKAEESR